ncbi:MAG: MmgE/PrpD family protein [Rhodospirillales bacterium]|nr:MmgE/PrpD family protein [Rhodospirillales bacterium]
MTTSNETAGILHSFASRQKYGQIPDRVKALAKLHIIDGIGVMLAGAATKAAHAFCRAHIVRSAGGADLVGAGHATSPALAAFANAFNGRVLDFDDVQTTDCSVYGLLPCPTIPVLSAALALGQAKNVSGQELLAAYLAGVEVAARLAENTDPKALNGRIAATATFGGIGAVLAAAKLLRLSLDQTKSTLAIWQTAAARHGQASTAGKNPVLRDAYSVRAAVEAALAAAEGAGITTPAATTWLEFARAPIHEASWGKPYAIVQPGFAIRGYPSHPLTHPALDLMLAIVNLHDLRPGAIKRVEVGITRVMAEMLSLKPPTAVGELRRSLPFAIALAASKGVVVPADFERRPRGKTSRDLIGRMRCRIDPELDSLGGERARTTLRVTLKNGRVIEMKTDVAKGTPQKPLSEIELFHKFFHCALPVLGARKAERLLNRLWLLDEAPHVAGLCRLDVRWPTDVDHRAGYVRAHADDEAHGRGHHAHLGHDNHGLPHEHGHDPCSNCSHCSNCRPSVPAQP